MFDDAGYSAVDGQPIEAYRTRRAAQLRADELNAGPDDSVGYTVGELELEDGISKAERAELAAKFRSLADAAFAEYAQHLKSFSFTLYTDYFNDGSPLQYRSYPCEVNGEEGGEIGSLTDSGKEWVRDAYQFGHAVQVRPEGALWKFWDAGISDLLGNFAEDELKVMFGDHVKVTVTPTGHEVTPFEDHE
jgi:hypothetical protein